MKKLLLILLLLPTLSFAITDEIKGVSCILDKDTFFKFYNSSECDKVWGCARTRYEIDICREPSQIERLEEKAEAIEKNRKIEEYKKRRADEKAKKRRAKEKADALEAKCIGRASQAKNDFTAKKIYNRCMKGK